MEGSETRGSSDEVEQQQDEMLPQLIVEVPVQRESLLGRQRLYQAWGGRNKYCCGGRLMTGPEPLHLVASVLLLLVPCLIFYLAVLPLIPDDKQLPCSICVFSLLGTSLVMLIVVAFTDPGVIPRGTGTPSERAKECIVNGHTITLRWCNSCNVLRPPRAKHCFTCNNCVASFDHHCPWISNCVGLRNRRSFFLFISFCSLLSIALGFATALAVLEEIERAKLSLGFSSLWKILTTCKGLGIEATICVVSGFPLLNLVGFNCYLIAKNVTTAEEFHQPYGTTNPFSEGWKKNCYNFWFQRPPASALDFHSFTASSSSVAPDPPDPSNWPSQETSDSIYAVEREAALRIPTQNV